MTPEDICPTCYHPFDLPARCTACEDMANAVVDEVLGDEIKELRAEVARIKSQLSNLTECARH